MNTCLQNCSVAFLHNNNNNYLEKHAVCVPFDQELTPFCQPHFINCARSSCWREESTRLQRSVRGRNGGGTSMESPATTAKEATSAAIQFEAPIISIPHVIRRARLLNNAAFDASRLQRGNCARGTPCKHHSHVFVRCFGNT